MDIKLASRSLKKKVFLSLSIGLVSLFILLFAAVAIFHGSYTGTIMEVNHQWLYSSLMHAVEHEKKDIKNLENLIFDKKTKDEYIESGSKKKLQEHLEEKYAYLKDKNPYLTAWNLHFADGESIVQDHKDSRLIKTPGDIDPLVIQTFKNKKTIFGYKLNNGSLLYVMTAPVLYADRVIGILEIVIDSKKIIDHFKETTGYEVIIVAKNDPGLDSYELFGSTSQEAENLFAQLPKNNDFDFEDDYLFSYSDKYFSVHSIDLYGQKSSKYAKILLFMDISHLEKNRTMIIYVLVLIILSALVFLLLFFRKHLIFFEKGLKKLHSSYIEDLKKSKKEYQELVENINDWAWKIDEQDRYTYVSPAVKEILGYEPEEVIGKTPFDLMPGIEAKRVGDIFLNYKKSKDSFKNLENVNTHKNGQKVILQTSGRPILDEKRKFCGYSGIDRDITQQKTMQKELKEKEEMMISQSRQAAMGDMIAMIAHQWRQPLTVAAMAANNIKIDLELENEISRAQLEEMTDLITEQMQHLSKTIDDFRNFFKPDKKQEVTTLCRVVDDTLKIVGRSLENNNIKLILSKNSKTEVLTYPNELLQVFLNIISNAKDELLEKNCENAQITISVFEENGTIKTEICDNAGGIDKDVMDKISTPYFTTKKEKGTGLGLYMSRIIVEGHLKGRLEWKNRDDAKGACFSVVLPEKGFLS